MLNLLRVATLTAALLAVSEPAVAVDAAGVPDGKRTAQGLYLTSTEVPGFLAQHSARALFIDVRTPEELAATGVATPVDGNAPIVLTAANGQRQLNPSFVAIIASRLGGKGLTKADPIVLICHSGRRSAMAANRLAEAGYTNVYSVVDGFEDDGPLGRGWKNSGLPVRPAN